MIKKCLDLELTLSTTIIIKLRERIYRRIFKWIASADGSTKTPTLFMEKEGLSEDKPVHFKLQDVKIMDGDSLWLRYTVKK